MEFPDWIQVKVKVLYHDVTLTFGSKFANKDPGAFPKGHPI